MDPRRIATAAPALCGTIVLAGWVVASLGGLGSASIEHSGAAPVERPAPSLIAPSLTAATEPVDVPPAVTTGGAVVADIGVTATAAVESVTVAAASITALPDEPKLYVEPAPLDQTESAAPAAPAAPVTSPVQVAAVNPTDLVPDEPKQAPGSIEIVDECPVVDICVDRYLWALYQRTPKEDTNKVLDRRKVTIRKKGRMVTVTRTFTRLVDADFTWKDPKAADRAGMTLMDYVIGGMDRGFKLKLFHVLHAAEEAGLSPGITSAFRDDYRQSIASGLKAASNRSYHGGSLRGGYGHGLAADIVSVKGATRDERWVSSDSLWKWVDIHGKEFGIGRPYLDRDPPHVAPIDGKEYVDHRGSGVRYAHADTKKRTRLAVRDEHRTMKRPKTARASKGRTT